MTKRMNLLLNVAGLSMGAVGVFLFFYRNYLFQQFSALGTNAADSIHSILVNNHGSYTYITPDQSSRLEFLEISSIVFFSVMIAIDVFGRLYLKKPG